MQGNIGILRYSKARYRYESSLNIKQLHTWKALSVLSLNKSEGTHFLESEFSSIPIHSELDICRVEIDSRAMDIDIQKQVYVS